MSSTEDSRVAGPDVDLDPDFQRELRDLARRLPDMDYYELLGVEPDADAEALRCAFFERSKRFHPDRYFRKELGPYKQILGEIYKRIVTANDVLRDAKLRAGYDKMLSSLPREGDSAESGGAAKPSGPSLRSRQGLGSRSHLLRGLKSQMRLSQNKAKRYVSQALERRDAGDWQKAAALFKHALAFDPRDRKIHEQFAEVAVQANESRAAEVLARGHALLKRGEDAEGLEYLREGAELRPTDAELATLVAELLVKRGGSDETLLREAVEVGQRAVDLTPDEGRARLALGRAHRALGQMGPARKQLQRAWELDPLNGEIKAELASL